MRFNHWVYASFLCARAILAQEIQTVQIASGVPVPTDIQNAGDRSGRLFFAQQNGVVRVFRDGSLVPQPFLNIQSKITSGGERGLLGMAFPPGFAANQRFYINYTDLNGDTVIAQYRVTANPDVADQASEIVLLHIQQPFANHNGGQLRFGPDGYLYIGMGDGGSGGDPFGNGQNLGVLLGKLLRVDVESDPGKVRIPADNPFLSRPGARGEIWAYGLRNPWRFSFDRATNDMFIADVGQDMWEEVDFQPAASRGGENYGWNLMEGAHCFQAGCSPQGLILPVAEYDHSQGCSVTGGFMYRGTVSPGLRGLYLYGDYCSGNIWGLERQGTQWANRLLLANGFLISTFGEDEAGELLIANARDGTIHRINGSRVPRINAGGVVNPASYAAGIVPGSLASAFAAGVKDTTGVIMANQLPLPASLGGVSVTLDGVAAPMLALANVDGVEQVNFQVPFELAGRSSTTLIVSRDGAAGPSVTVPVLETQPAVYSADGAQAIVVHNVDYTLVTPAHALIPGEDAFVYATGLGPVTNGPPSGAATPRAPLASAINTVQLTLGNVPCEVPFAGLAPSLTGVYQVSFRVPQNVPSGMQTLLLRMGSSTAPPLQVPVR